MILALLQPAPDVIVIPGTDTYSGVDEYGALNAYSLAVLLTFCVCCIVLCLCYMHRSKYSLPYYTRKERELSATVPRDSGGRYNRVLIGEGEGEDDAEGTSLTESLITVRNTYANSQSSTSPGAVALSPDPGMGSFAHSTYTTPSKSTKPTGTTTPTPAATATTPAGGNSVALPRTNTNPGIGTPQTLTSQFYTISPTKRL